MAKCEAFCAPPRRPAYPNAPRPCDAEPQSPCPTTSAPPLFCRTCTRASPTKLTPLPRLKPPPIPRRHATRTYFGPLPRARFDGPRKANPYDIAAVNTRGGESLADFDDKKRPSRDAPQTREPPLVTLY